MPDSGLGLLVAVDLCQPPGFARRTNAEDARNVTQVHLVDGTYELFRHFFAVPSHANAAGEEVGAVRGTLGSVVMLMEEGATHVGVATDRVIESFRNDLWPGYKTGAGIDPLLWSQFPLLEDALAAAGIVVWPMVAYEADDALASAAAVAAVDPSIEQVVICTPDKDLGQCVSGNRVVQLDRRQHKVLDDAGVKEKFGVAPESIPDWLALVGDSADGFPGLPGWGAKSAATVLAHYRHLEDIPPMGERWDVAVRSANKLAGVLVEQRELAFLFRDLATLRDDADVGLVNEWRWQAPRPEFAEWAVRLDAPGLASRLERLAVRRG